MFNCIEINIEISIYFRFTLIIIYRFPKDNVIINVKKYLGVND